MRFKLFCILVLLWGAQSAVALGMPYTITDQKLVRIDISNQMLVPIGNEWLFANCLEYSEDHFLYGVDSWAEILLRIDPVTGSSTTVGPLGVDDPWNADLAEDEHGQLWMLAGGNLYTVNRTTGAAVLQCQANLAEISGLAILDGRMLTTPGHPNSPEPGCGLEYGSSFMHYLDIGPGNWIYGLRVIRLFQTTWNLVYRVDPITGDEEEIARFFVREDELRGLAFPPVQPPPPTIPVLGFGGRALFIVLLTIAGAATLTHFSTRRF